MPKINVYLPDELAAAVRDAQLPVSGICQAALERAVREVSAMRGTDTEAMAAGAAGGAEAGHNPYVRFTPRARAVMTGAQEAARQHGHKRAEPEHLLLALLEEGGNLALKVLGALEVEPEDVRSELLGSLPPAGKKAPPLQPPFSAPAKEVLEATMKEAMALGHNYIGCEHLLLGLLAVDDTVAGKVLRRLGVELRTTRRAVVTALSGVVHARQAPAAAAPAAAPPGDQKLDEILQRLEAIERRLPG